MVNRRSLLMLGAGAAIKGDKAGVSAPEFARYPTAVQPAPNIASLRSIVPNPNQIITVSGYYSEGDGGGGQFYAVEGANYVDDSGMVILPGSISDGSIAWKRMVDGAINVKFYGAKGDGVADDTAAVQNAVNSGTRNVYFPSGTYKIAAKNGVGVILPTSVTLFGDGPTSVIKSSPSLLGDQKYYSNNLFTTASNINQITFKDLCFDGAGSGSGGHGYAHEYALILCYNVDRLLFSDITVKNYSSDWDGVEKTLYSRRFSAICVRNCKSTEYTRFIRVSLIDNHFEQVDVYNPQESNSLTLIENCSEINTTAAPDSHTAFQITGGHCRIINSSFRNTRFSTININNIESALISGCTFIDQHPLGLAPAINFGQSLWYGCNNCTVINNYFRNCDIGAINHAGGDNLIISKNTFINAGRNPIKVRANMDSTSFLLAMSDYYPFTPSLQDSHSVIICENYIKGTNASDGTGYAIWLSYVDQSAGKLWRGVEISNNTILSHAPLNKVGFCIVIDTVQDARIRNNYLQYAHNAIFSQARCEKITIDANYFDAVTTTSGSDMLFENAFSSSQLTVTNNLFASLPRGAAYNIAMSKGRTFDSIIILNNKNTKPEYLVSTSSRYFASNLLGSMISTAPKAGVFAKFDRIQIIPESHAPFEYVVSVSGCFATITATATGVAGDFFVTVTDAAQFTPGMYIEISGMNTDGGSISRIVTEVDTVNNTVYIDKAVVVSASAQTVYAKAPAFLKVASHYTLE